MRTPLIVELFRALPEPRQPEDADYWDERLGRALEEFRREVCARYNESTLERLLHSADPECRRAAVVALGLVGTMLTPIAVQLDLLLMSPLQFIQDPVRLPRQCRLAVTTR